MRTVVAFAALAAAALAPTPGSAQGACTTLWAPVCALKDDARKTYSNAGCAKADGAKLVAEGPCPDPTPAPTKPPIFCAEVYNPVCAIKDNAIRTYSNACFAKADGARIISEGECAVQ